jgi:hypothetical protein
MAVSDDALQRNEGSRAARPEPLPFLLFMCPVATTSATHQAHNFSSLLPHIDLTTASSKEPMNHFNAGTHSSSGMNFRHDTAHPAAYSGKIPRSLGRYPHSLGQKSHARWAIRRREPHARHRAALSELKRSQTSATEKTGTPASRADWPTYCEIFRPQSVGYLPALGVSPAHLMWGLTVTDWRAYLTILGQFT